MATINQERLDQIVETLKAKGLNIVHADCYAHHRRMTTIVEDRGEPDHVTVYEVWSDHLDDDQVVGQIMEIRNHPDSAGGYFTIGHNPIPVGDVGLGMEGNANG